MMAKSGLDMAESLIDLAEAADFDLGGLRVRPARRELCANGQCRELEPRVMQVLVALASARPTVVSRHRLIESCWDGRIVGDDAINRCVVALRQLARQFTPPPFAIETVPRVGYCLLEQSSDRHQDQRSARRWHRIIAAGLLVLALVAVGAYLGLRQNTSGKDAPISIAILPFRSLSGEPPHLAEGLGEELLSQLGREPQFRLAGGLSASQLSDTTDLREIGRQLAVDYVLQGSVRTQSDRVRVNANLVRLSDGVQLWAESYDGSLNDIFAIQQQLGVDIAGALRRRLTHTAKLSGPLVTKGDAYSLYLTARGLIRTNNRATGETAANLLRDAIRIDPGFAPAWASLATAVRLSGAMNGHEGFVAVTPEAQRHARRALSLAPNLAEAHRILGTMQGYGTIEAQNHLRRAARLDPNSADNMIWLGVAHGAAGEFSEEQAAYRRALEIDPLWFRTVKQLAVSVAEMGDRSGAEAIVRRGHPSDEISRNLTLGRIALVFGDFSEAARRWQLVASSNSPRWANLARRNLSDATFAVGVVSGPLVRVPPPDDQRRMAPVWIDSAPGPRVWQARNRDRIAAEVYRDENHKAAKLMLRAGRHAELITTFDSPIGLFGIGRGRALRADQLHEVAVTVIALRNVNRRAEADRLLAAADSLIRTIYRRGPAPFWFDADAAGIRALQGRPNEALSLLERAFSRGWTHTGPTDLRVIADEPAFAALRESPRLARLRTRLANHMARERAEVLRSPI